MVSSFPFDKMALNMKKVSAHRFRRTTLLAIGCSAVLVGVGLARVLLTYMLDVVNVLSKVPHAFVQQLALPIDQMLAMYGIVAAATLALWHKTHARVL